MTGDSVPALAAALHRGIQALPGTWPGDLPRQLLRYLSLLQRWNRAYNLSAVREPQEMVTRHLLDSLAAVPYLRGPRLLDVGSGAGLPGLVIAMARPDWAVTVLDSNTKKVTFLRQARMELELAQVEVVQARAERHVPQAPFDSVISRAYSSLAVYYEQARRLVAPGGRIVAMKGQWPEKEIAELERDAVPFRGHAVAVPGLEAQRHLIVMSPDSNA